MIIYTLPAGELEGLVAGGSTAAPAAANTIRLCHVIIFILIHALMSLPANHSKRVVRTSTFGLVAG